MADGSVKIDITADDSDIKKKLSGVDDDAETAADGLDKLGDSAENAGKSFDTTDIAIGNFVGNALTSLKDNIIETIGNIAALADETREYREDMAKLDTAFTDAGHSTETAQNAYDGFYKILGESDRSVEAVNHLAELTKNEKEVAQWSTIAAGVTAKFGDSLPIEGLTEAANETAKVGAVTGPLADALNWAGISEDEFNKKLAACNSEQERASLITSTLNTEYAAAAEEYNKLTANTQAARDATNNMEQAQAELGAAIEPVTTAWLNMKANALQWFVDVGLPALQTGWQWIQNNLPAIAVIVGGLTAAWLAFGGAQTLVNAVQTAGIAIQTALNIVMNANPIGLIILAITALVAGFMLLWNNCEGFRNFWIGLWDGIQNVISVVVEWVKENWQTMLLFLMNPLAGVFKYCYDHFEGFRNFVNNIVSSVKDFFVQTWESIKNAFFAVVDWIKENWQAMLLFIMNPLAGVFKYCYDHFEGFRNFVDGIVSAVKNFFVNAWENIKTTTLNLVEKISEFFTTAWENIQNAFASVTTWFSDKFTAAKDAIILVFSNIKEKFAEIRQKIQDAFASVTTWFSEKFTAAKDAILSVFSNIKEKFGEIKDKIFNAFSNIKDKFLEVGSNIVAGIKNGVKNAWDNMVQWFKGLFGDLVGIAKKILGIASPSKVFRDEVGAMIPAGIEVGWESNIDDVKAKMATDMQDLTAQAKTAVSLENARMAQGVGVRDTGFTEVAQAVGMQTAGINSLASEYRRGSSAQVTVPLILNGRELGRAIVDLGNEENARIGTNLVLA